MVTWNRPQTIALAHASESLVAEESQRQFRIFSILWAVATLFHLAHSSLFNTQANFILLTLVALYVVVKPRVASVTLLAALQVFDALYRMPFTTNHWLFTAFVNLTILHSLLYLVIKNRSLVIPEALLIRAFGPVVRWEVIILYFFAAFHKLNAGFFSPETSCAFDLLKAQHMDQILPFTDDFYRWNPFLTIAIEWSIPVLLCIPRTRLVAIFTGIFFHGVLAFSSYNAFYDFSSMIFAVYFLFTGPQLASYVRHSASRIKANVRKTFMSFSGYKLAFLFGVFLTGGVLLAILNQTLNSPWTVHLSLWGFYVFALVLTLVSFLMRQSKTSAQASFTLVHWSLVAVPILVFANGMSPYLGLKTENSYAMFSNLRTEGGVTNHFIVPAGLQLFGFQKDVVEILSSSDPGLKDLAQEKKAIVLFEFIKLLESRKPAYVEYLLNGEKRIYRQADRSTHAVVPAHWFLLNKLMRFRTFAKNDPQPCNH